MIPLFVKNSSINHKKLLHSDIDSYELLEIAIVKNAVDDIRSSIEYLYIEPKNKKQRNIQDNIWEELQWLKSNYEKVYNELIKELRERGVDIE